MKYKILTLILLILLLSFNSTAIAYNHQIVKSYITYRIKYIHDIAHNTNIKLSKRRAREYAESIIHWSDYYSSEFNIKIDPLLVTSILETETNFVSRSDYDNGNSIGISSMKVKTARWIADKLNVNYNKWRMLDATDLGIRFTVYYLARSYQKYDNLDKIITSYNQGLNSMQNRDMDKLYNNYLFKVLGRYNYYKKRINFYQDSAARYFKYKLSQLE